MSEFIRCVGCGVIVEAQEPCSCVFDVAGALDAQGVLHTTARVPAEFSEDWLDEGDHMEMAYRRISAKEYAPVEGWACYECGSHSTSVEKRQCHDGALLSLCLDCWFDLYRN